MRLAFKNKKEQKWKKEIFIAIDVIKQFSKREYSEQREVRLGSAFQLQHAK